MTENWEFYSFLDSHGRILLEPKRRVTSINKKRFWYRYISLTDYEWKAKNWIAHRVVAITYIPNPLNLPEINHRDWDKNNISVSNLEWCTSSENKQHAIKILWHDYYRNKTDNLRQMSSKRVSQYTKEWIFIKSYDSATDASTLFSKSWGGNISSACRWNTEYAYGFIWKYT